MKPLPAEAEVVVIGAGVAGAATAASLRERGLRPLLIERFRSPGHESSGRSAGMIRQHSGDAVTAALLEEGAAWHRSEGADHFTPSGSLLIGLGEEDVSEVVPWARGRGRHFESDGLCDAEALLLRYLGGQTIHWDLAVSAIESEGDRLRVDTDRGAVRASVVVNAGGAWAGELGSLPLEPRRRHLFRTAEAPPGGCEPFVWDVDAGFYFRPWEAGLLVCACDEEAGKPGDNREDPQAEGWLLAKARELQPAIADLRLIDSWAGQRTFAPDGRFVIGWDPRVRGLFHVAGLGGHGITASPAVGRRAAEGILAGPAAADPGAPLSPARLL